MYNPNPMRRHILLILLAAGALAAVQGPVADSPEIFGFSAAAADRQREIESRFGRVPTADSARRHHRRLTEEPHVAGQPAQRRLAEYIAEQMRLAGLTARLVEYQVLLSYPVHSRLQLVEPAAVDLPLAEDGIDEDKDSFSRDVIAPYHAYSPSGRVEAEVIYANYGLPEDYRRLDELGLSVEGRIVLVRYGRSFRGVKVRLAQERGARAVLIYSDPFDDGYFRGDIYPEGPMRPPSAVQRGSVQYLFIHPGDPLTPGRGATADALRLAREEAANLPQIPSHPLPYRAARLILESLKGHNVPEGWQGALPFAYHVGPGPARVRFDIENEFRVESIFNVIAEIEGAEFPDQRVIAGNHIDAWTYGAVDPNSGTTALIELARGLGELLRQGERPRRTIVLAGWDGEEFGLLGSTEWGEAHARRLAGTTVAYLNVDSAVSGGRFAASAVPSLSRLIREAAASVSDPATGISLLDAWRKTSGQEAPPRPAMLGSGSDYTVFLDHLGIASLDLSFRGAYGVYHSIYDTHQWMSRFGDPGWQRHTAMARLLGALVLRLANAEILPFDFSEYGEALVGYLTALEAEAGAAGVAIDWEPLKREAGRMQRLGREVAEGIQTTLSGPGVAGATAERINQLTLEMEAVFLLEEGLAGRPWFKHAIYAPGFNTGYAAQPLPGIADAIRRQPQTAGREAGRVLVALQQVNRKLDQIRRMTQ